MIDLSQATTSETDLERKQLFEPLKWCPPILEQRAAKGKLLKGMDNLFFIAGFMFLGFGITLLLDSYNVISLEEERILPPSISIYMNILFIPTAAGFFISGWSVMRNKKILEENKNLKPDSPWSWDFVWNPDGVRDDLVEQLFGRAWMLFYGIGIMGPLSWMIIVYGSGFYGTYFLLMMSIIIFMDLIFIAAVLLFTYQSLKYLKYGISKIKFLDFPFFLQGEIKAQLNNLPKKISQMTLDLRFIQEEHIYKGKDYICKYFQLYKETKTFVEVPEKWDGVLLIEWELPSQQEFATTLNKQPSNYWELEVKAETPGIDYHSRFLLPIYAKP